MKRCLLPIAVLFILSLPLLTNISSQAALAGHVMGGGFCSPCCDAGQCLCDPGEQPDCGPNGLSLDPGSDDGKSQSSEDVDWVPLTPFGAMLLLLMLKHLITR